MVDVWLSLQLYSNNFDAEFLFNDTDSLNYEIKSKDVSKKFFKHKHFFDFNNYPKDLNFFDETNKKVISKMKDEFGGVIVDELVGLKLKIYSLKKMMVKNLIRQKEWILQQNLMNLMMFCLIKKLLDIKWK